MFDQDDSIPDIDADESEAIPTCEIQPAAAAISNDAGRPSLIPDYSRGVGVIFSSANERRLSPGKIALVHIMAR